MYRPIIHVYVYCLVGLYINYTVSSSALSLIRIESFVRSIQKTTMTSRQVRRYGNRDSAGNVVTPIAIDAFTAIPLAVIEWAAGADPHAFLDVGSAIL